MIDERRLVEWLVEHKILARRDDIASDGKYFYGIDFAVEIAEIKRLAGIESEVREDDKEAEIG